MSVNDSHVLKDSMSANTEITDCQKKMLIYDIYKQKYFIISTLKKHTPFHKDISASSKVISSNSSNSYSNERDLLSKEGYSFVDIIKKDEQFINSIKDKAVVQDIASNLVLVKNQQNYVGSVMKNFLIHDASKNGSLNAGLSSDNIITTVGKSSISNENSETPSSAQAISCKNCLKVFDNSYLLQHNCTALKTYECESCKEKFSDTISLSRHKLVHMDKKSEKDSTYKEVSNLGYQSCTPAVSVIPNKNTVTPLLAKTYICNDCQKVFDSNYLLALHKCTALKSFACDYCVMSFLNTYSLNRHKKIHSNKKSYKASGYKVSNSVNKFAAMGENNLPTKNSLSSPPAHTCESCQKIFENDYQLALHKCTTLTSFACETCKISFPNPYSLHQHQQGHASEKSYEDVTLKKTSSSDNNLSASEEGALLNKSSVTPTPEEVYTCKFCQKVFDKNYLLTLHKCIASKPFECDSFNKKFPNRNSVQRHQQIRTGVKPNCSVCNKNFSDHSALRKHKLIHTGEKPFVCNICDARFTQSSHMKTHVIKRHINKKPPKVKSKVRKSYICNFCQKVFPQKIRLYVHFRTHTGERPYECDSCTKKFSNASGLKRHKRVHTGERPFACGVCDSQFSQSSTLMTHMMDVHMGNDAYVCDICNESFPKKRNFLMHYRSHTGEKPHVCSICKDEFSNQQALRKHQVIHYNESLS